VYGSSGPYVESFDHRQSLLPQQQIKHPAAADVRPAERNPAGAPTGRTVQVVVCPDVLRGVEAVRAPLQSPQVIQDLHVRAAGLLERVGQHGEADGVEVAESSYQ
jgi:hypothetical protein